MPTPESASAGAYGAGGMPGVGMPGAGMPGAPGYPAQPGYGVSLALGNTNF